jgi:RNA polymerase sigma factor (sigma-70 family)
MDPNNLVDGGPRPSYRPISAALAIASTVSVIIPARNEAANLPHVFGTVPPWVDEVVLVDGHSVDDTVAVTRALCPQAKVVSQPGKGKGDALRAGFATATGDILVTLDADGSTDGAEVVRFVSALVAGADFAKGSRFSSSGGSDDITGVRRYGNRLLSVLVNWMFRTNFTDLCYGYNAFWARHLDAIEVSSGPGFEVETLMSIRAAKAGLRIYEVPSHESPRIFGTSNLRAVRDGWRILKVILREWLRGLGKQEPIHLKAAPEPGPGAMGWHDIEGNAGDREIAAAITAGDATGIAAAFDQYAQGLYTYFRSVLSEPTDADDAVVATFVIASAEAARLGQPDRLRAWLFAVARNECHARLRAASPSARLYEAASAMDDTGAFAVITGQAEFRAVVRAALAGMDPMDREISELNLRHGFYGADLADLLGTPRNRAPSLASRVRARLQRSLGVLLVAELERENCRELATILDRDGAQSAPRLRWQVRRHIGRCEVCGERKRSGLNPATLRGLFPEIPVPGELRQRTLDLLRDQSPAALAYRTEVFDRAAPLRADGFPVQLATPSRPRWRVNSVSAVAAAAAAVALLGGVMFYGHDPSGHTGPVAGAWRFSPPGSAGSAGGSPTPHHSPSSAAHAPFSAPGFVLFGPGPTGSCSSATPKRQQIASASPVTPAPSAAPTCSPSPSRSPSTSPSRSGSPSPSSSPSPSPSPLPPAPSVTHRKPVPVVISVWLAKSGASQ